MSDGYSTEEALALLADSPSEKRGYSTEEALAAISAQKPQIQPAPFAPPSIAEERPSRQLPSLTAGALMPDLGRVRTTTTPAYPGEDDRLPMESAYEGVVRTLAQGPKAVVQTPIDMAKEAAYKAGYGETRPDDIAGEPDTQGAFADAARALMALLPPVAGFTAVRAPLASAMAESRAEGVEPNGFAGAVDAPYSGFEHKMEELRDIGERQIPYLVTGDPDARSPLGGLGMEVAPFGIAAAAPKVRAGASRLIGETLPLRDIPIPEAPPTAVVGEAVPGATSAKLRGVREGKLTRREAGLPEVQPEQRARALRGAVKRGEITAKEAGVPELIPPKSEGTVPMPRERAIAEMGGPEGEAARTGRVVVEQADGSKAIVPKDRVAEAEALAAEGRLAEIVNGEGNGQKPVEPTEVVRVKDADGQPVRDVLTDSPEKTKAAVDAQPEGAEVTVEKATPETLGRALEERAPVTQEQPAPKSKLKGTEPDPLSEQARGEAGTPKELGSRARPEPEVPPGMTVPDAPKKPVRRSEITREIEKFGDAPMRFGRMGNKRKEVAGFYKEHDRVPRARERNDIQTQAHEMGHHIEVEYGIDAKNAPPEVRVRLDRIGRDLYGDNKPADGYVREGFAEAVMEYLHEGGIKDPVVAKWLDDVLFSKNPKLAEQGERVRGMVEQWNAQGPEGRLKSLSHDKAPREESLAVRIFTGRAQRSELRLWDTIRARWEDRHRVLAVMEERATGKTPGKDSFTERIRALDRTRHSSAENYVFHGNLIENGRLVRGDSLGDVFAKVQTEGKMEGAQRYIEAMNGLDDIKNGVKTAISEADLRAVADKYGSDPAIVEAQQRFVKFQQRLFRKIMVEDMGLPKADVEAAMKRHPNYARIVRIVSGEVPGKGTGNRIANTRAGWLGRKGSTREYYDVIDSSIAEAARLTSIGNRVRQAREIVKWADKTGGLGRWITEVPPDKVSTTFSLETIKPQLRELLGKDVVDDLLSGFENELLTIYSNARLPRESTVLTLVGKNGKMRWFEVDPEVSRYLAGVSDPAAMNAIARAMRVHARMVRLGATGVNASFSLVSNPIRDAFGYMMNTSERNPVRAVGNLARGHFVEGARRTHSAVTGKPRSIANELYDTSGADLGSWYGQDRPSLSRIRHEALATNAKARAIAVVRHPIDLLRNTLGLPERGTRIGEFLNSLKEQGVDIDAGQLPTEAQLLKAANAASEVSIDFSRAGEFGRSVNKYVPFFNAAIQGGAKMARMAKSNPAQLGTRGFLYITIPTIINYMMNRDDEFVRGLPSWLRDRYWIVKAPRTESGYIRIPKPFDYGLPFSSAIERSLDALRDDTDIQDAFEGFGGSAAEAYLPGALPPSVELGYELSANESLFRGSPIVPRRLQGVEKTQQYTEYNSDTSRIVSEALGGALSPAYIDHINAQTTGGLGRDVVNGAEWALELVGAKNPRQRSPFNRVPVLGTFNVDPIATKRYDNFWDNRAAIMEATNTTRLREKEAWRGGSGTPREGSKSDLRKLTKYTSEVKALREKARKSKSESDRRAFLAKVREAEQFTKDMLKRMRAEIAE